MKRIFRVLNYYFKFFISYIPAFFIKVFCKKKRNIWLISERGDDARDNGYFFYKYLKEKHPEQIVFYIIKKSSVDAKKIATEDIIEPGTFKHFIYFALSRVRISSHAFGGDIPLADYYLKSGFYKKEKKKSVFLQHGITKDFQPSLCFPHFKPDLFICGAEPEFRYIRDNFCHRENVVKYTGFARFDSLKNITIKNQILVMPTFRKWLQGTKKEDFCKTEYFEKWQRLINNPTIINLLEKYNLELIFYPHYEMQPYVDLFKVENERIKIADFDHYDVQTLLKETKLLITDFSSVFFDYSYMNKPVIFYQYDRERYIKDHYDFTKGYFSYDTMAPGKVTFDEDELIKEISKVFENNFVVEKEYTNRKNAFFTKQGENCCDNIFAAISKL